MRFMGASDHHDAIRNHGKAKQMEYIEGTDELGIGLQEFPGKTLNAVPSHEEIEAIAQEQLRAVCDFPHENNEKGEHRRRFIELHRMAADTVAEVDAPGESGLHAIGVIGQ